jgi:glycosyltransferase involved in cell wall biosynthesis
MKPRVLFASEFSQLKTGYAIYTKEVLSRLFATSKYDIMEFASYCNKNDPRLQQVPWKVFPVLPEQHEQEQYNTDPTNQFGAWKFEQACLTHKPHIVMAIRDFWMDSHQLASPFRPYFYHIWMPTVDAYPQHEQWIASYSECDAVLTYQDWSLKVLEQQGGGIINLCGSAPPCASSNFKPLDKKSIKEQFGFPNHKIVGTVMRNQKRKLYPQLFRAFRNYLNQHKKNDVLLYCHTSYPDAGWDIPRLLISNEITSKVLFTYVCDNCNVFYPNFFSDAVSICPNCHKPSTHMVNVQKGVDEQELAIIYNFFDVYVQYSNSEGFGMPTLEAAQCGIPIMETNYSAMTDILQKTEGIPIELQSLEVEAETGCFRAVPNEQDFLQKLHKILCMTPVERQQLGLKIRNNCLKTYNWNNTAQTWMNIIDKVDIDKYEQSWNMPSTAKMPANQPPENITNVEFAKWLIAEVLGEPWRLGSYMEARLVRDLNQGFTPPVVGSMYFSEMSTLAGKPNFKPFSRKDAYEHMVSLCTRRNHWEELRCQS